MVCDVFVGGRTGLGVLRAVFPKTVSHPVFSLQTGAVDATDASPLHKCCLWSPRSHLPEVQIAHRQSFAALLSAVLAAQAKPSLPRLWCSTKMVRTSSTVNGAFDTAGSSSLTHRIRHCLSLFPQRRGIAAALWEE